jgi:predicted component of type VI protein secretion system
MKPDGDHLPLITYCLRSHISTLTFADLIDCAQHFKLETRGVTSRPEIVRLLAAFLAEGDEHFVQQVMQAEQQAEDVAAGLVKDPLAEEVFDDMDPDDKIGFLDVGDELRRRRVRAQAADVQRKRKPPALPQCQVKRRRRRAPAPEALPLPAPAASGDVPLPRPLPAAEACCDSPLPVPLPAPEASGDSQVPLPLPAPEAGGGALPLPLPAPKAV